jgi:hypothetical protein
MGIAYNTSVVRNGLVLHLDAANVKSYPGSGTTWTDLSGNGNNGTLVNGPTYNGANNGSVVFDGANDYVSVTNNSNLTPTNTASLSFWIKPTSYPASFNAVGGWSRSGTGGGIMIDMNSSNGLYFYVGDSSWASTFLPGGQRPTLNVWTNVVGTYDGSTLILYTNAIQRSSASATKTITYANKFFEIGQYGQGTANRFTGEISSTLFYNRALTAAEIRQNFEATRGRYGI